MSVQKISVDDNDGSIGYSGPWSPMSNAGSYQNSLHLATNIGASASLSFTGISVNIVGTVSPCTTSGRPVTFQVTMNGGTGQSGSVACTTQTQNGVVFYSSGALDNGPHTVTLINEGSSIPLMLDMFSYVKESSIGGGLGGASSTSNQVQSTVTPANVGGTSGPSASASSISASNGASWGSSATNSSSPSTSASGNASTEPALAVSTVMMLTTINGVATSMTVLTTYTPTPIPGGKSNPNSPPSRSAGSGKQLIGAIAGGIIAALVVILILLLLLRRCRRRRNPRVDAPLLNHSPESLTPFNLEQNPSREQAEGLVGTSSSLILLRQPATPLTSLQPQLPTSSTEKIQIPEEAPSSSFSDFFSQESAHFFDEKRASGPRPAVASLNLPPPFLPPLRPPSSIPPSEVVPAYARDTDGGHYRSGISGLSDRGPSQISDIPPSYDSVRDEDSRTRPQAPGPGGALIVTDASRFV